MPVAPAPADTPPLPAMGGPLVRAYDGGPSLTTPGLLDTLEREHLRVPL